MWSWMVAGGQGEVSWARLMLKQAIAGVWEASKRALEKRWPWIVAAGVVLALAVWLGWLLRTGRLETGFGEYRAVQGVERAKTLWDWMDLLLVPGLLAAGAWLLNRAAKTREQKVEEDRACQIALQAYLDRVTTLLRDEWRESGDSFVEARIIRAQTLTVLRQLDGERKGLLLRFLYESGLVGKVSKENERKEALVYLSGANLSGANLGRADLSGADLSRAALRGANLRTADLSGANLSRADLRGADLSGAALYGADLSRADLWGANLTGATLIGANLSAAFLFEACLYGADLTGAKATDEHLAQAKCLKWATMPDGTRHGATKQAEGTQAAEAEAARPEAEIAEAEGNSSSRGI